MLHRTQQLGIDPSQPRQRLGVEPIVFLAGLPDQPHVARMRHDHFVPQLAQDSAHPRRMRPGFQRDPTVRHFAEPLAHRFRSRAQFLFLQHVTHFVEQAIPTRPIAQVQTNRQLRLGNSCSASSLRC
jgi:hypothetical protein